MRAFGSAVGTTVVTLGALAGTTAAIGGAGLMVVKRLVKHQEMKRAVTCSICRGERKQRCEVCKGKLVLEWTPLKAATVQRLCLCPTCGGSGKACCLNCVGEGVVCLPA